MHSLTGGDFPLWLTLLSAVSLIIAGAIAAWVVVDVRRRPQPMGVMNVVWPVTMLFGSGLALAFYRRWGRAALPDAREEDAEESPYPVSVGIGTSHCGAGCALGDLIAEFAVALIPGLAAALGAGTLFSHELFAAWILDYIVAWLLGIGFQYFSIAPARGLSLRDGLIAAIKADTLSITAWQVGMYGVMALIQFLVIVPIFGDTVSPLSPEFWFMMQFAMLGGFATAYPVNWLLIRKGLKERM